MTGAACADSRECHDRRGLKVTQGIQRPAGPHPKPEEQHWGLIRRIRPRGARGMAGLKDTGPAKRTRRQGRAQNAVDNSRDGPAKYSEYGFNVGNRPHRIGHRWRRQTFDDGVRWAPLMVVRAGERRWGRFETPRAASTGRVQLANIEEGPLNDVRTTLSATPL